MDRNDAAQCIRVLRAAHPRTELPDETIALWLKTLMEYPLQVAIQAIERLIDEDVTFPKIARFREVAGVFAPPRERARWGAASACSLCEGTGLTADDQGREFVCSCTSYGPMPEPVDGAGPSQVSAILDAARRLVAERKLAGKHWHGGPDPCPVCGGMRESA